MICLITSEWRAAPIFRIAVLPSRETGLEKPSQIMIDKVVTLPRNKIGRVIGRVDDETMVAVNRAFAVFTGLV
jgi:mRNA interferase MazF